MVSVTEQLAALGSVALESAEFKITDLQQHDILALWGLKLLEFQQKPLN